VGADSVAFRQGVLHGTDAQHLEQRRIDDGRLLAEYDLPHDPAATEQARRAMASWTTCTLR
jgi:hypothetical protein